jgi:hypothetical protein
MLILLLCIQKRLNFSFPHLVTSSQLPICVKKSSYFRVAFLISHVQCRVTVLHAKARAVVKKISQGAQNMTTNIIQDSVYGVAKQRTELYSLQL